MAEPASPDAEPIELSAEEFRRLLDARARRDLGLSVEEFIALADAGELPDTSVAMKLALMVGERPR